MTEIPEVYGVWEPPCCGDPGDCNEPCASRRPLRWEVPLPIVVDPRMPPGVIGIRWMTRAEIEAKYGPSEPPRLERTDGKPVDPRAELLFQAAIEDGLLERAGEQASGIAAWSAITGKPAPARLTREVLDRTMAYMAKRGAEPDPRPHHPSCPVLRAPLAGPRPRPGDGLCTCGAWPR